MSINKEHQSSQGSKDVDAVTSEEQAIDAEASARDLERTRWQYRIVNIGMFNAPQRLAVILGKLGSQGWELVHVYDKASNWLNGMEKGFALFRRSVAPGEHPDGGWGMWERIDAHMQKLPPLEKGTEEGWYPDPSGRYPDRWWDGKQWSDYTRDKPGDQGGQRFEDPAVM